LIKWSPVTIGQRTNQSESRE